MLELKDIIEYLNIGQEKLNDLYIPSVYISKYNDILILPTSIIGLNPELSKYSYMNNNDKNIRDTFIYSLLMMIDETFYEIGKYDKMEYIKEFRKKLCYDFDNKNLNKEFGYNRKRNNSKTFIKQGLLKLDFGIDNDPIGKEIIIKYILDYFQLNLVVFALDDKLSLVEVKKYLGYNNDKCRFIMMVMKGDVYYPVISDGGKKNIIDGYTSDLTKTFWTLKVEENEKNVEAEIIPKIVPKIVPESEPNIKDGAETGEETKEDTEAKTGDKKIRNGIKITKKMLLNKLQEIATENGISLTKTVKKDEKTEKIISKTKTELYEELKNLA